MDCLDRLESIIIMSTIYRNMFWSGIKEMQMNTTKAKTINLHHLRKSALVITILLARRDPHKPRRPILPPAGISCIRSNFKENTSWMIYKPEFEVPTYGGGHDFGVDVAESSLAVPEIDRPF